MVEWWTGGKNCNEDRQIWLEIAWGSRGIQDSRTLSSRYQEASRPMGNHVTTVSLETTSSMGLGSFNFPPASVSHAAPESILCPAQHASSRGPNHYVKFMAWNLIQHIKHLPASAMKALHVPGGGTQALAAAPLACHARAIGYSSWW